MTGGKMFKLKKPVGNTRLEKLNEYAVFLERKVEETERVVNNLVPKNFTSNILKEKSFNENTAALVRESWNQLDSEVVDRINFRDVPSDQKNVGLHESFFTNIISSVQTSTLVTEAYGSVRNWVVLSQPVQDNPEIQLRTTFRTIENQQGEKETFPSIEAIKFKVIGMEGLANLVEAIQLCEVQNDLQLFNRLLEEYIEIYKHRRKLLDKAISQQFIVLKGQNILEFRANESKTLLHMCLNINFSSETLGWLTAWSCKFTERGREVGASCNIPEQLMFEGFYKDWTAEYCIETLAKMCKFHQVTPSKPTPSNPTNLSQERGFTMLTNMYKGWRRMLILCKVNVAY